MSEYDPRILEGLRELKEKAAKRHQDALKQKSCGGDVSYFTNPNLERARVQTEIINLVRDTSKLLGAVTSQNKDECSGKITRLDSCRVTAADACGTGCGSGFSFEDSYIPYDMKKYSAEFVVPEDFLECNELGDKRTVNEIMQAMMLTNIRNDMEMAFIYGNESIPVSAASSDEDKLLAKNDGILRQIERMVPASQIIDAAGAGFSPALFMAMRKSLPPRYRMDRNMYSVIGGPGMTDWYSEYLAGRVTDAGDAALRNGEVDKLWGNMFFEVPTWREDFTYNAQEVTHLVFAKLSNFRYLTQRKFDLKTEYKLECDHWFSKAYWKQDHLVSRPEEVVLVKNVDVCGTPWDGCVTSPQDCDRTIVNPFA